MLYWPSWPCAERHINISYGLILTVSNRQSIQMVALILALFLSVSINLFIVPIYGLIGTAYVSIFTHFFIFGIYVFCARNEVRDFLFDQCSSKLVGIAVLYLLVTAFFTLSERGALVVAAMFVAAAIASGMDRGQLEVMRRKFLKT